jgi:potassium-transporting ATPase KdpC subunit
MTEHLRPALVLILLFTLLTGLVLPLGMTGIAGAAFPFQAGGSLLSRNGKIVGSALVGQNFTTERYFHPRPSATTATDPADPDKTVAAPYRADASGASNLGPTSKALVERVQADIASAGPAPAPADAVTMSASGLDPDVSPATALRQVPRVAAARGMEEARLRQLVAQHTQLPLLGFIGMARVNVLALNLALDAVPPR